MRSSTFKKSIMGLMGPRIKKSASFLQQSDRTRSSSLNKSEEAINDYGILGSQKSPKAQRKKGSTGSLS